jgi:2-polyprenyl-3-methyl-5-hydroxy-6-metoxy-1,4-benzoquinol methylase
MTGSKEKSEVKCPLCETHATLFLTLVHTAVWECRAPSCGLQFAYPQLGEEALSRAYSQLYYPPDGNKDEITFENTPDRVLSQIFQKLEQRLGSLRGLQLLDYGCGRGKLLRAAKEFGMRPVGVEQDPQARAVAGRLPGAAIYANVSELQAAGHIGQFDIITLWTVIEHLRNPWEDLASLYSLLRPGGSLLVSTMDISCLRARIERGRWENYENPTHLYYFDRISLSRTIQAAGFSNFSEWRLKLSYDHHGSARRWLYKMMFALRLADGLFFICKRDLQVNSSEEITGSLHSNASESPRDGTWFAPRTTHFRIHTLEKRLES